MVRAICIKCYHWKYICVRLSMHFTKKSLKDNQETRGNSNKLRV